MVVFVEWNLSVLIFCHTLSKGCFLSKQFYSLVIKTLPNPSVLCARIIWTQMRTRWSYNMRKCRISLYDLHLKMHSLKYIKPNHEHLLLSCRAKRRKSIPSLYVLMRNWEQDVLHSNQAETDVKINSGTEGELLQWCSPMETPGGT